MLIVGVMMFFNTNVLLSAKDNILVNEVEPFYEVVPCSGSSNQLTKISSTVPKVIGRTGRFYESGSTAHVTETYEVTVSNSAVISLIPEFLQLGYEQSYSAGTTLGWSQTNTSSTTKELVVKAYYDQYRIVMLTYLGYSECKLEILYRNLYKGWGWGFN